MATENAKQLLSKLNKDKALREKFQTAGNSGFEQLAKSEGLDCTREEFAGVVRDVIVSEKLPKADTFSVAASIIQTSITSII